jgi:hypothetical protein
MYCKIPLSSYDFKGRSVKPYQSSLTLFYAFISNLMPNSYKLIYVKITRKGTLTWENIKLMPSVVPILEHGG